MSCTNSKALKQLRSLLRQRIYVEYNGCSKKPHGKLLASIAGDYLNHIKMFSSEGQVNCFIKKHIDKIQEIAVDNEKSKSFEILIKLVYAENTTFKQKL